MWFAAEAGARQLALFHHDPAHDDDELDRLADAGDRMWTRARRRGVRRTRGHDRAARTALSLLRELVSAIVMNVVVVASVLLGAAFLVAGGSKIAAGPQWPVQAAGLGAPRIVVPVLPWVELVIGALLVVQVARPVPAVAALAMLLGVHRV